MLSLTTPPEPEKTIGEGWGVGVRNREDERGVIGRKIGWNLPRMDLSKKDLRREDK